MTDQQKRGHNRGHQEHYLSGEDDGLTLCLVAVRNLVEPGTWPLCARCRAIDNRRRRVPREVSTVQEINALPAGTVLLGKELPCGGRNLFQRPGLSDTDDGEPGWWVMGIGDPTGGDYRSPARRVARDAPLLVLWVP